MQKNNAHCISSHACTHKGIDNFQSHGPTLKTLLVGNKRFISTENKIVSFCKHCLYWLIQTIEAHSYYCDSTYGIGCLARLI